MPKKSSIAIFLAATSALTIATTETNTLNAGENDLGGLKEWNTDMPIDADFILDAEAQKIKDEKIVKSIASQLFEVSIHRVKREFQSVHSENNFNLLKNSESGIKMSVSGKNQGDKYRVKNNCINMVYRKIHGTIIEIFVEEFLHTGIGCLSKKYSSQSIDPDTLKSKSQKLEYEDEFINIGEEDYWILNSRTIKYLNQNQEEETQKFVFENLSLLK